MYDIIIGRTEEELKKFGKKGVISLGKQFIQMGQTTSMSNEIYLDVIRSHVVLIVGKRGSGKCLTGDTFVTLGDGSLCPIKELAEKKENIFALNVRVQTAEAEAPEFFKRTVKKLLHITFRSGKEIKLTPEHPLLTLDGWKEAKDLSEKYRIATPRIIPSFGNNSMPEHEIKILAYLLTEGHTKRPMLFTNMDSLILRDMQSSLLSLHPDLKLVHRKKGHYKINSQNIIRKVLSYSIKRNKLGQFITGSSIIIEKTPIRQLVEKSGMFNKLAIEKELPQEIFQLPKNQLALFLNRAFSCDGSIYKPNKNQKYWEVSYSTSSEKLAKQIHHILLRFNILSRLRNKKVKYKNKIFASYEIVLDGENVKKYIHNIGFFGEKEKKQKIALEELQNKKYNPNVDTIPKEIWNFYKPNNWAALGRELGYAHPKALRESIRYSPSRQKLLQIAVADNNQRLKSLAESDIFWDEITQIEELFGEFEVFDITVPQFHNFIANDIIVHNSYSMGVIAEGISDLPDEVKGNISVIILDTMGVYWTMKYPNKKEEMLLKDWGLKSKPIDVQIYTPTGFHKQYLKEGIPTDFAFSIKPCELDAADWQLTFGVTNNEPIGVFIERIITQLKENKSEYNIEDIISEIKKDNRAEQSVKDAAENRFFNALSWGLFDKEGTPLLQLAQGGKVTVLDVSCYATMPNGWAIKSLVIGLLSQKLFIQRMIARKNEEYGQVSNAIHYFSSDENIQQETPMIWLVIDEAHEFLPVQGKTAASDALITILREGRQPGISLILATQQPGKIHTDVMTQSDTVISHRITAKIDVDALGALMQSYMREGLSAQLDNLPRIFGSALIFDDTNERLYPMKVRPRMSWHGGSSPSAYHGNNTEL